jgi:transposase
MIAAISKWRIEGLLLRHGSTNQVTVLDFILSLLRRITSEGEINPQDVVFYLDNATYHKSRLILDAFRLLRVSFIYAPAYCSWLNPIELFFRSVKILMQSYTSSTM